jgi:hypothetical protein
MEKVHGHCVCFCVCFWCVSVLKINISEAFVKLSESIITYVRINHNHLTKDHFGDTTESDT